MPNGLTEAGGIRTAGIAGALAGGIRGLESFRASQLQILEAQAALDEFREKQRARKEQREAGGIFAQLLREPVVEAQVAERPSIVGPLTEAQQQALEPQITTRQRTLGETFAETIAKTKGIPPSPEIIKPLVTLETEIAKTKRATEAITGRKTLAEIKGDVQKDVALFRSERRIVEEDVKQLGKLEIQKRRKQLKLILEDGKQFRHLDKQERAAAKSELSRRDFDSLKGDIEAQIRATDNEAEKLDLLHDIYLLEIEENDLVQQLQGREPSLPPKIVEPGEVTPLSTGERIIGDKKRPKVKFEVLEE